MFFLNLKLREHHPLQQGIKTANLSAGVISMDLETIIHKD
jgi:hypothetical protein